MSKNNNYVKETIRNVPAFIKAYFKGDHGRNQLTRPVRFREETANNSKGKPVTHRIPIGYNTIAEAFYKAAA